MAEITEASNVTWRYGKPPKDIGHCLVAYKWGKKDCDTYVDDGSLIGNYWVGVGDEVICHKNKVYAWVKYPAPPATPARWEGENDGGKQQD
jgi:hypothetical protein